ncbi:NADPH-dependent FMN reductase [Roseovarius phycicola]|uniref:NADPH-dependent FMN reductase n=1 Tax=Roseovarius phycicola TaxID=3080976 RepID=A0ABZ2HHZ7_9RHOB
MSEPNLLLISGSLRKASYNRALLRVAAQAFGPAGVTEADITFPIYNGDDEDADGAPKSVHRFAEQIRRADALLIGSPEYNKGISGALKNALDWLSRIDMPALRHKPTVVMSAAAGRTGGETALFMTLSCLSQFQVRFVFGPAIMVADASKQFDENGRLTSETYQKLVDERMEALRGAIA